MEKLKRADMYRGQLQDLKNRLIEKIKETILIITEGDTEEQVELKRPIILIENDSDANLNEIIAAINATTVYIGNMFEPSEITIEKLNIDILISLLDSLEDELNL